MKMFIGLATMLLLVLFTATYEGARRGFLASDPACVDRMEGNSKQVEELLSSSPEGTIEKWKLRARNGDRAALRALGLLALTGRGGVEVPESDMVMSRDWALFGFSLYFGFAVVGYYIIRPLWMRNRGQPMVSCLSAIALIASFYFAGLYVFHYARLWYPAISAFAAKQTAAIIH